MRSGFNWDLNKHGLEVALDVLKIVLNRLKVLNIQNFI